MKSWRYSIFLGIILSPSLCAQSAANSGQIVGHVLDPSGAAAAHVEVSARNVGTNFTRTAMTDLEGRYAVGPVPLGGYEVTVKTSNLEAIKQQVYVSLGGRATANFTLGLAPVRTSIDVESTGIEPAQTF